MAGNRRAPPVVPPAGGIRVLGRIGSLGPGFRIFRIIARFSKYDFRIPGEIWDLYRKKSIKKYFFRDQKNCRKSRKNIFRDQKIFGEKIFGEVNEK